MQEFESSAEISQLAAALSKAQGEFSGAKKDSENPYFKSKYADIASLIEAIRQPLSRNGLAYLQSINDDTILTYLFHSSGEWIKTVYPFVVEQIGKIQATGAAATYARRYALMMTLGVPAEDDDGESAKVPGSKPSVSMPTAKEPVIDYAKVDTLLQDFQKCLNPAELEKIGKKNKIFIDSLPNKQKNELKECYKMMKSNFELAEAMK